MERLLLALLLGLTALQVQAERYYFSGGKDNVVHQVAARILVKAYRNAGIDMQPLFLPLELSLQMSNAGETDGELARIGAITDLYPNLRRVPVRLISVEAVVFSKNRQLRFRNWGDLAGHDITVVKGTKFIERGVGDLPHTRVESFEQAFARLQRDDTGLVVAPKLAGLKQVYQRGYDDITIVSPSLETLDLYHFVHKKNARLVPVLQPVLQAMRDSGEIAFMREAFITGLAKTEH